MGIFSKFENRMEDTLEGAANSLSNAPISPVQIEKKAEKQMRREKMVGAGKQYAPTLYTVLVNPDDDRRMFGYYPTLAGEIETYLKGKAYQEGLVMDGDPLVRFVVDESLKRGKFDVIAEAVAAPIVEQLRQEELQRYGIAPQPQPLYGYQPQPYANAYQPQPAVNDAWGNDAAYAAVVQNWGTPAQQQVVQPAQQALAAQQAQDSLQPKPPLPYVPEDEIDRSIDYGEYTFNSEDFEDYRAKVSVPLPDRSQAVQAADAAAAAQAAALHQAAAQQQPEPQLGAAPNTIAYAEGNGAVSGAPAVHARIIDIAYRRAYDLAGTRITIGRESGNDIVVQDINASRRHAEMRLTPQGVWTITDLGSTNGTVVNGVAVASQALSAGDILTIGKTELEFTIL